MTKKTVTMSDIASQIGVSTVTVSKALSGKDGVSAELRERIKQKANEMGYRFSGSAKSTKNIPTYNIGVIVAKHFIHDASAFYWVVYRYIVELLQKQSYYGILEVVSDSDEQLCEMPTSVLNKKVDGIIILGQFKEEYVSALLSMEIPTVFLDFYSGKNDVETVLADNFFGAYTITNYLIRNGHRKIGFVGSIGATSSIQDRFLGCCKSHIEHNLRMDSIRIVEDRKEDGTLLPEFSLPDELPTAFFCNCDETAYQLINQLKAAGYRVPEDISVVGYDNHIYSTISSPRITTVDVNSYHMSHEAVEIIIRKIRDNSYRCGRVLVTGKLVERDSVKKIHPSQKETD